MSDDKQLKQAVLEELKWEPSLDATHIDVAAKSGSLRSPAMSRATPKNLRPRRLRAASRT